MQNASRLLSYHHIPTSARYAGLFISQRRLRGHDRKCPSAVKGTSPRRLIAHADLFKLVIASPNVHPLHRRHDLAVCMLPKARMRDPRPTHRSEQRSSQVRCPTPKSRGRVARFSRAHPLWATPGVINHPPTGIASLRAHATMRSWERPPVQRSHVAHATSHKSSTDRSTQQICTGDHIRTGDPSEQPTPQACSFPHAASRYVLSCKDSKHYRLVLM